MSRIQLAYSTFGLTNLDFTDALVEVDKAGYDGVEISFHRDHFNPFNINDADLEQIRRQLDELRIKPACVATASHFFNPLRPHDPSLMAPSLAGRKRRIDLIKRGIHVARKLGAPLVTFGSGFVRAEHLGKPEIDPWQLLVESIQECVSEIRDDEDITLLIEPEPGMLIETMQEGLDIIEAVDSPRFRLHIDMCHAYCSETDYVAALGQAAPMARYLHVSDAQQGYNLKIVNAADELEFDLDFASYLVYFPQTADFLLVDREHPCLFSDGVPGASVLQRSAMMLRQAGIDAQPRQVDYNTLYAGSSELDDEIFTYLISIPGMDFEVLERAAPIIAWLRGANAPALVTQRVANTLTGIVHFHEIPGRGTMDFAASFKALTDHGFTGFGTLELYHDVNNWQQALTESHDHLRPLLQK